MAKLQKTSRTAESRKGAKKASAQAKSARTDGEIAAIDRLGERLKSYRPPAKYKVEKGPDGVAIRADHAEPEINTILLVDSFGTASTTFARTLRDQITRVAGTGEELTADEMNGMLAMVRGIGPRDEIEAMLAVQMAAIHNATMIAARRLNRATYVPQQESAGNLFVKLSRTFSMQMETLKKHRSAGEQVIKVQHISVADGGQAIVGDIVQPQGGGSHETQHQPHAPQAARHNQVAADPALLGYQQAIPLPLPGACSERAERVSDARRTRRRAQR